jgi:uncharacterized membrane protein YphA (DoxX/SURF4 family)
MKALQLVGRILLGILFAMYGVFHFLQVENMAGYAASKGVPLPEVAVILTGVMILLGGLSVIFGYKPRFGLWLLVAFLVPVAFIMHNFWAVGAEQQQMEMTNFLKNLSIAGAALMLLNTDVESWPYSLGGSSDGPTA